MFLIVKLSPNVSDISVFAKTAKESGADAVSAINTVMGMKINTRTRKPHFINKTAGLSGPAIHPIAVRMIYQIYASVDMPIIGLGGISCFDDMLELIFAGASAVSVGTMNMVQPGCAEKFVREFETYCERENISSMAELIGGCSPLIK